MFTAEQIEIAKRLTLGAAIYQNCFLEDAILREQFNDSYKALVVLVEKYAYERQGAAPAYPIIAKMAIEKLFRGGITTVTMDHTKEAWKNYQEIARNDFNNLSLNKSHNPMNSNGGVLATMATKQISNICLYVKGLIQRGKTRSAHDLIESIRGIGPKMHACMQNTLTKLRKSVTNLPDFPCAIRREKNHRQHKVTSQRILSPDSDVRNPLSRHTNNTPHTRTQKDT